MLYEITRQVSYDLIRNIEILKDSTWWKNPEGWQWRSKLESLTNLVPQKSS